MEAIKEPDWNTVGILGAARGARSGSGGALGTEHLLAGITTSKGPAREALASEGATKTALLAVLRHRQDRDGAWSATDDAEESVDAREVLGDDDGRSDRFTGAAARALTKAMGDAEREGAAKFGAPHLLRALLDEDHRAVELLGACGIAPQAVRARLDGTGDSATDALPPLLHATRDRLLGRDHYRHMPFWKRWLVKRSGINWASRPARWVSLETYEQAQRLGAAAVGTEHVLLAILATHEVAQRHPHLATENASTPDLRYTGGERLTRLGLDYTSVHKALTGGRVHLLPDPHPLTHYLDRATPPTATSAPTSTDDFPPDPGTGPLVESLLSEQTRAHQLITTLTAPPTT
ncbi:Clp protease N-terminal domain-containing protein [Streptomyces sp. SP18BB07]|uniref:Clp protease N-terminal domain-containing protein n=1 Tax=Streptomyces sp. SP18BB07 TaxID=3002522 RepID=UPI002E7626EF|nr:Clp protease N-terminal domain-containing protein [Streptomyces sp. SP18BB07]MEE1764702.1 Clp protease N-terminal domain-containing protein [Streptomyces sp. SP18BB07]